MELRIRLTGARARELADDLSNRGMAQSVTPDGGGFVLDLGEMALPPGANADDQREMRAQADAIVEGIRGLAFDMNCVIEVLT